MCGFCIELGDVEYYFGCLDGVGECVVLVVLSVGEDVLVVFVLLVEG